MSIKRRRSAFEAIEFASFFDLPFSFLGNKKFDTLTGNEINTASSNNKTTVNSIFLYYWLLKEIAKMMESIHIVYSSRDLYGFITVSPWLRSAFDLLVSNSIYQSLLVDRGI